LLTSKQKAAMKFSLNRRKGSGLFHHQTLRNDSAYPLERIPSLQRSDESTGTSDGSSDWETFANPLLSQQLQWPGGKSKEDADATEVRKVLEETGVIQKKSNPHQSSSEPAPITQETQMGPRKAEPVWKRRFHSVKASVDQSAYKFSTEEATIIKPYQVTKPAQHNPTESIPSKDKPEKAEPTEKETPQDNYVQNKTQGKAPITKSVSFDESSLPKMRSGSPICSPPRKGPKYRISKMDEKAVGSPKKKGRGSRETEDASPTDTDLLTALRGVGSSFSEIFNDLEVDLFSLDTPSYISNDASACTESSMTDEDTRTTMSSYPRASRRRRRDGDDDYDGAEGGCSLSAEELLDAVGASISNDLKLFADLLVEEATCFQCADEKSED
jgi:hypothetical protein